MADYGLSALGITLWAAESSDGTKVTTPASYSQLTRVSAIGELTVEQESIEVTALEDYYSRNVPGISTVGDTFTVTINWTNETYKEWKTLEGKTVCFMEKIPGFTEGDIFVIAAVPNKLPMPPAETNSAITVDINCVTKDFIGVSDAITVTSSAG
jgi:hypothetical protein